MLEFACHTNPEAKAEIRGIPDQPLPEVSHPSPPSISIARRGRVEEYLVKGKAGTGSEFLGSGRAQALGIGLGLGSGFAKFGFEAVGLY